MAATLSLFPAVLWAQALQVSGGVDAWLRVADNYEFGKEHAHAITTQVYFQFSKQF